MAPLRPSTTKSKSLPDDPRGFVPSRLWKLPSITTWDDSRNQNHPTDSAEEADLDSRELAGNPVNYTWYHSPALQRTNTPDEAMRILVWDFVYAGNAWSKLGLAVPFYGRIKTGCLDETGTTGVTDSNHPWLGGTESRSIPYRDLVTATHWSLGAHVWDESHSSQYIQDLTGSCATDTFIPSAGPDQLRAVAGLVRATRLGGIATYGLPYEYMARHVGDARYPLSTALYDAIIESYTGPLTTPP